MSRRLEAERECEHGRRCGKCRDAEKHEQVGDVHRVARDAEEPVVGEAVRARAAEVPRCLRLECEAGRVERGARSEERALRADREGEGQQDDGSGQEVVGDPCRTVLLAGGNVGCSHRPVAPCEGRCDVAHGEPG